MDESLDISCQPCIIRRTVEIRLSGGTATANGLDLQSKTLYDRCMKTCSRCNVDKELSDFYKRKKSRDGYRGTCKECDKRYIKQWKDKSDVYKINEANRKATVRKILREKYIRYMTDKTCIDCGNDDIRLLVHDHVRGKKIGCVLQLLNTLHKWEKILEEIEKCEVRCHNCHFLKSAERGEWWFTKSESVPER